MTPQKVIDISTLDYGPVRIRVYPKGIIMERGGETIAFMGGVAVPDWLVEKLPEEIDPRELFRIKRPEVRSRFISKMGFRRLLEELDGRVADRCFGERLIVFMDAGRRRVYLMRSGQSPAWYLEQVDPALTSVKDAWSWFERREIAKVRQERLCRGIRC